MEDLTYPTKKTIFVAQLNVAMILLRLVFACSNLSFLMRAVCKLPKSVSFIRNMLISFILAYQVDLAEWWVWKTHKAFITTLQVYSEGLEQQAQNIIRLELNNQNAISIVIAFVYFAHTSVPHSPSHPPSFPLSPPVPCQTNKSPQLPASEPAKPSPRPPPCLGGSGLSLAVSSDRTAVVPVGLALGGEERSHNAVPPPHHRLFKQERGRRARQIRGTLPWLCSLTV